jgi:pimeloyl-ACP methyl ester carboxylesterase
MEPNLQVHQLEIPGNGSRFCEISPLSPETIIEDFRSQLFRENAQFPIRLVGISLGGMLALKWTELYPNEIESSFIINSSLRSISPFFLRLLPSSWKYLFKAMVTLHRQRREQYILQMTVNKKEIILQHLQGFTNIANRQPLRFGNFVRQMILATEIRIHQPLSTPLIFVCAQSDRMVHHSCSQRLQEFFGGELHMHPFAGHDLPLEEPEWLAKIILSQPRARSNGGG